MKAVNVNDEVLVYGATSVPGLGTMNGVKAVVESLHWDGTFYVQFEDGVIANVHNMQCRYVDGSEVPYAEAEMP